MFQICKQTTPLLCKDMLKWKAQEARLEAKIERDRKAACTWAYDLMQSSDWAIIDTETSELKGVVLEIGIIAPDGSTIYHGHVSADGEKISESVREIHGITDQELERAPKLYEIWDDILLALAERKTLIAYNVEFDKARLANFFQNTASSLEYILTCLAMPIAFCRSSKQAQPYFAVFSIKLLRCA